MPQASEDQRELMNRWFGDPIDDSSPTKFLLARGWTEIGGLWVKPTPSHTMSPYEYECLMFLCCEWDHAFEGDLSYSVTEGIS